MQEKTHDVAGTLGKKDIDFWLNGQAEALKLLQSATYFYEDGPFTLKAWAEFDETPVFNTRGMLATVMLAYHIYTGKAEKPTVKQTRKTFEISAPTQGKVKFTAVFKEIYRDDFIFTVMAKQNGIIASIEEVIVRPSMELNYTETINIFSCDAKFHAAI